MDQTQSTSTPSNTLQHSTPSNNDTPSVEKQLLNAYFQTSEQQDCGHIAKMASILLSANPQSPTTLPPSTPIFDFTSFMELRSQYIGPINTNAFTNINPDDPNIYNSLTQDHLLFNSTLFHAALLTDTPSIIDSMMKYINFDWTTFSLPHDEIDLIQQNNSVDSIKYYNPTTNSNYLLSAIVHATQSGYYQSVQHLIENYQLSPTIYIYNRDCTAMRNLLYHATESTNLQLIQYLLPLCFSSTNEKILKHTISQIASHGYLPLLQQLHTEYNVNLVDTPNLLLSGMKSNNIELIDYIIEVIGIVPTVKHLLHAIQLHKWDTVTHLINKYSINIHEMYDTLYYATEDGNMTPTIFDHILTTFALTADDIHSSPEPLLFRFAHTNNIICMKHLIDKYNVNPHVRSTSPSNRDHTLFSSILYTFNSQPSIELLDYLYELGCDVNNGGEHDQLKLPIYLATNKRHPLYIFQSLLEHKAIIQDIHQFIQHVVSLSNWPIVQYLLEAYQPQLDVTNITYMNTSLLRRAVRHYPSIDFITYLLSLPEINIKDEDQLIFTAIQSPHCTLDVIQLLYNNGAKCSIHDWLKMVNNKNCSKFDPIDFFTKLDYFQNTFGYDIAHSPSTRSPDVISPLLSITYEIKRALGSNYTHHLNYAIIHRTLIHRYKINVNDQHPKTGNTIFHLLTEPHQLHLLRFTLLYSFHKPNIFLTNSKQQTFLHALLIQTYQSPIDYFEDLFNDIIEVIIRDE